MKKKTPLGIDIIHLGGEQTVTGSCHLLQANGLNIMVDCGLAQGNDSVLRMESWPVKPSEIDYLFLTHGKQMGSSLRLTLSPVKTICMHGSPLSKWDNRDLWKRYNYRDFGIIAEPYFDLDFDEVFYITDTGRSWNKSA